MFLLSSFLALFAHLPEPYNAVDPVLPFVDHGWYVNAKPLHRLIHEHDVKIIVEVGSWLGKSTMDLARTVPEDGRIYAIDHWQGSVEHQEGQFAWHEALPRLYEQFLSNVIHAGLTHKIMPIRMDSLSAARAFNGRPDLVYIDAGHETEAVYADMVAWYPHVVGRGILCGDDWSWKTVQKAVKRFAKERGLKVESEGNFWRLK